MEKKTIFSNLFYSIIACFFIPSIGVSIFLGTFGWIISGWDPFNWTNSENYLEIFLGPVIYYISCLVSLFTFEILVSKTTTHKISTYIRVNNMGSMFGIFGYFMIPIGIGILTSTYGAQSGERTSPAPFLLLYIGFTAIIGLFIFYIVWCDPSPQNNTELKEWYEYSANTKIPIRKWFIIWLVFYLMAPGLSFIPFYFLGTIFSDSVPSYYTNPQDFYIFLEAIILFPGPLLHIISFIIYYWHPIRIKLNLYLLKHRSGIPEDKISINQDNRDFKGDYNDKKTHSNDLLKELDQEFTGKSPWIRFLILILLVQLFVIFFFEGIQSSPSWQSFIIIYSFWIWLFYLNMFITSYLGKRFGLVKS